MAGLTGFEPVNDWIKTSCVRPLHHRPINGGDGEIRTRVFDVLTSYVYKLSYVFRHHNNLSDVWNIRLPMNFL